MNTSEFIETVRRTGQLSSNDPVYTAAEILAEGTQALRDRFAAPIMLCRQGFWLKETVIVTNNLGIAYKIPANTIVQGLEKVEIAPPGSSDYRQLFILTQAQAQPFRADPRGEPTHFTLEADHIRLWPAPNGAHNLRLVFYLQPPELMEFQACRILFLSPFISPTTFVVDTDPSLLGIVPGGGVYVQNKDGSHEVPVFDCTVTAINGTGPYDIVTTGIHGMGIQNGDYVTPKGFSVFPMLPLELHRPLCDYTAGTIWLSKGDKEKSGLLTQKAGAGIDRFVEMAVSRVKTRPITWKRTNSYLRRAL